MLSVCLCIFCGQAHASRWRVEHHVSFSLTTGYSITHLTHLKTGRTIKAREPTIDQIKPCAHQVELVLSWWAVWLTYLGP